MQRSVCLVGLHGIKLRSGFAGGFRFIRKNGAGGGRRVHGKKRGTEAVAKG
jgi:hypothetical protein